MENATAIAPAPSPRLYLQGEAAEPEMEPTAPGGSKPKADLARPIPRPKQEGIVLPVIPFYVRNNAPDLQEFLIF